MLLFYMRARIALFVLLTQFVSSCGYHPVAKPGDSINAYSKYLDEAVPELMKQYDVPGVAIAVIHGGALVWSGTYGYADPVKHKKIQLDSVFRVESISKSLTAWGVMRLVKKGRIDLDRPLQQYLKNWRLPSSNYALKAITARRLLSHNAGLPLGAIGDAMEYPPGEEIPTLRETLSQEFRLVSEPGSGFAYSNVGFNLLELLIEEVTGQSFSDYMAEEILRPLGMVQSSFKWQESLRVLLPTGHDLRGNPVAAYVYPVHGAGGLLATVEDIARFVEAEMMGSNFVDHGVLSERAIRQLHTPQVDIPGVLGLVADAYGLGHFVEQLPDGRWAVWHGGQGHGWMSHYHVVPESGDGIVILTNSQRSWPLFAKVLTDWASWSGVGSVKMGRISYGITALRALTGMVLLVILWQVFRLVRGLRSGNLHWAPLLVFFTFKRSSQMATGLVMVMLLAWSALKPYSIVSAVFPSVADLASVALLVLAVMMILTALLSYDRVNQS